MDYQQDCAAASAVIASVAYEGIENGTLARFRKKRQILDH